MTDYEKVRAIFGAIAGASAAIWATAPSMLQALLALMVIDFVSGVLTAVKRKELDSEVGAIGLRGKALMLCVVAGAGVAAKMLGDVTGLALPAVETMAGFYCAIELLSIVENAIRAGVPAPKFLTDALVKARDLFDSGEAMRG